jgi:hypothetical protein
MCAIRNDHIVDVPKHRRSSFELLGVDLLVDEDLKIWLLEINITPGMYPASELDTFVKSQVAFDLYNVVRLVDFTVKESAACHEFVRIERIMRRSLNDSRKEAVVKQAVNPWDDPVFFDHMIIREFVDEQLRRRRFERAYPKRKTMDQYTKCFDGFSYEDIVLGTWVRMNREERLAAISKKVDKFREEMKREFPSGGTTSERCNVA